MASSAASSTSSPQPAEATPAGAGLRQAQDARTFLAQWMLWLVGRTPGLTTALLLAQDESGALVPAFMWPEAIADVSELAGPVQLCVDTRSDVVQALPDAVQGQARCVVAAPMFSDNTLIAAVVMITIRTRDAEVRNLLADVQWGAGWIDALHRQRRTEDRREALSHAQHALDMLALVAGYDRVDDACAAMASELARASGCERVAVGMAQGRRVKLSAMSHAAWFEQRSTIATTIEAAMNEAVEQRATLHWSGARLGSQVGAQASGLPDHASDNASHNQLDHTLIAQAQKTLAGDQAALTVPIVAGTRAVGAVTWQLPQAQLTPEFIARGQALAVVLAPVLARMADQSRWWAGRAPALAKQGWQALTDTRRPSFMVGAGLLLAALIGICFVDTAYRVPARASLEGQVQRVIAAPFEGFVLEAPARAGQTVTRGTLLARLDDRDLKLEQAKLGAELTQQEKKRDEAQARHDQAELSVLSAQAAETEAKLNQVEERLSRTRIEAPFDGVLVSGDLSQNIGSPVEQGKVLFELAPLDGYRVALKVDERDIRSVKPGQSGELMLVGLTGARLPFVVKHVSVAGVEEGQNVFRVEADLRAPDRGLRPGMEGVGKIDAGQHTLLWIWTHRAVEWVRVSLWRYLP